MQRSPGDGEMPHLLVVTTIRNPREMEVFLLQSLKLKVHNGDIFVSFLSFSFSFLRAKMAPPVKGT